LSAEALAAVGLVVAIAVLVVAFVGRPLWTGEGDPPPADPRAVALLAQREAVLATLRDLDADHAAGRLPEADWQSLRAQALARGAATLAALDQVAADAAGSTADWMAIIEAEVAAAQPAVAPAAPSAAPSPEPPALAACASCGAPLRAEDRFCGRCGQPRPAAAEAGA